MTNEEGVIAAKLVKEQRRCTDRYLLSERRRDTMVLHNEPKSRLLSFPRFYADSATWTVDRQFLWGKHLLITPVLDPVSQKHKHSNATL